MQKISRLIGNQITIKMMSNFLLKIKVKDHLVENLQNKTLHQRRITKGPN